MLRRVLFAFAVCLAQVFVAAPARSYDDLEMRTLSHAGVQRRVGIYVPSSYRSGQTAPLIVALHNRFSSAKAFHALSHLRAVAEAHGAILAYPETVGGFWNDGGFELLGRREAPQDDAGYLDMLVEALQREYAIDQDRVFLVGYDTGGAMAYRVACNGGAPFRAVAVVSALMWDYVANTCGSARPLPVLIVHGRRNDLFPIEGGAVHPSIDARRLGRDDTLGFWRRVNGCGEATTRRGESAVFTGCQSGGPVAYVEVPGGEHDWFRAGDAYQLNQNGVNAADLVSAFFFARDRFTLPDARGGGDRARSYFVYVPPNYDAATPAPVLIMLHGRPQSATSIAMDAQLNLVAARHGFIVVYPQGLNNEWNSFYDLIRRRNVVPQDDEAFLRTLMDDLAVDLNIDRTRMYVAGFSNGGFMTIRLACTSSDYFAGFAAVGAGLYTALTGRCRGRPAPFMLIHGTGDESVPYEGVTQIDGTTGDETRVSLGAQDTVAFFVRRNGCSLNGQSMRIAERGASPETHVIRFAPYECDNGANVMFYIVNGGAHNLPGLMGSGPDPINMDIVTGEIIWDFLRGHRLEAPPPANSR